MCLATADILDSETITVVFIRGVLLSDSSLVPDICRVATE